jgi:hypothetical protein
MSRDAMNRRSDCSAHVQGAVHTTGHMIFKQVFEGEDHDGIRANGRLRVCVE